jgi:hypothetical protein
MDDDAAAVMRVAFAAGVAGLFGRSITPVMDAVVRPVARASWPTVIPPVKLRMLRQFRSVVLMPM